VVVGVVLACLWLLAPTQGRAQEALCEEYVAAANEQLAEAAEAVREGDQARAAALLASTARNLQRWTGSMAQVVVQDRQQWGEFAPPVVNDLPEELDVTYYQATLASMQDKYAQYRSRLASLEQDNTAAGRQLLFNSLKALANTAKGIYEAVTDQNIFKVGYNIINLAAQIEGDIADIEASYITLEGGRTLYERLLRSKAMHVELFREVRRVYGAVQQLQPDVQRIQAALPMLRSSLAAGFAMPLPPANQPRFDAGPYDAALQDIGARVSAGSVAWASVPGLVDNVCARAQAAFDALPAPSGEDRSEHSGFQQRCGAFASGLEAGRQADLDQAAALGQQWQAAMLTLLQPYAELSFGQPVEQEDCSEHHPVERTLAMAPSDPRRWVQDYEGPGNPSRDYDALLRRAAGPPIEVGGGGSRLESVRTYPARLAERVALLERASESALASITYEDWHALSWGTGYPIQPYSLFVLTRDSLHGVQRNLEQLAWEADRFDAAFRQGGATLATLAADVAQASARAEAYLAFLDAHPNTTPRSELADAYALGDADLPGLADLVPLGTGGLTPLETLALGDLLEAELADYEAEMDSRPPDIPPCDLALMRRSPLALRSL